jgi:hypothetical protein
LVGLVGWLVLLSDPAAMLAMFVSLAVVVDDIDSHSQDSPIDNNEIAISQLHMAIFQNLKVNVSTRMSMVYIKFQITLQSDTAENTVIESTSSYPLIVITNESQWCEAKGKLIMMDCFNGLVRYSSSLSLSHSLTLHLCTNHS